MMDKKQYYQNRREELLKYQKQYNQNHKAKRAEYGKRWRAEHFSHIKNWWTEHPLYCTWHNIRERCFNSNNNRYKNYGGRGIKICDAWMDYKTFEKWCLANGWQPGLTIDRTDNDGSYEPENCQIVTRSENSKKR